MHENLVCGGGLTMLPVKKSARLQAQLSKSSGSHDSPSGADWAWKHIISASHTCTILTHVAAFQSSTLQHSATMQRVFMQHVRPCAQGRCGRYPLGFDVMSDFFFFCVLCNTVACQRRMGSNQWSCSLATISQQM